MQLSLSARLFLAEVSGSTKKSIMQMYQNKPTFPKEEAEVDAALNAMDQCLPQGLPPNKQKVYLRYLAKQLWGINPPGWKLGEDEPRVKQTLAAFELALKEKRLSGNAANIEGYATLQDAAEAAGTEKEQKVKAEFSIDNLPEEADLAGQPGNPRKDVAEGSKVIATAGAWKCYKINQGDPKGKAAGSWLGANKWWGVSWCVGRDYSGTAWQSRPYMDEGNFYFLVKDGISRYAIATDSYKADLYNPADSVIWTTKGTSNGSFPNLEATAQKLGVAFDPTTITTLPSDTLEILRAATQADPYLAERIPPTQLNDTDTGSIDRLIIDTEPSALVKDLNANSNHRGMGIVNGLLARCVSRKVAKDFSGVWDQFNESVMIAYIEALAAAGYKSLPPSLDDYFVKEAENFEF